MSFELRRGHEDSARVDELKFEVLMEEVTGDEILFKALFENPRKVSIGSELDVIVATILDVSFFSDTNSEATLD